MRGRRRKIDIEQEAEDTRVQNLIREVENALVFLDDETRSLAFLSLKLQLELLKELRRQRVEFTGFLKSNQEGEEDVSG